MPPNFDPAQSSGAEPTVITTRMSQPNSLGGRIIEDVSNPDPGQAAAAEFARQNSQAQWQAGIAGAPGQAGYAQAAGPGGAPVAAPADDSTIVVSQPPAPPPQITVVPKPGTPAAAPGAGAALPPARPDNELLGLAAAATSPASPTGDAVDQALAADAAARGVPPPAKPGDLAASGAAATAAGAAQKAALTEAGAVDQTNAAAETAAREKLARESEIKAAEQKKDRDTSAAHVQQLRDKAAKEPYHSFWETKTAAQEALAGIGLLLGAASLSAGHVNQSIGIIDRAIKQDFDAQQAKHAQLFKDVDQAIEQHQQLRSDQLDDMSNFRARQAQTLDAVIAKGKELGALSKNKQAVAELDAKNTQLAFERDKAYSEAERLKQASLETARHNKAEEGLQRAKANRENAAGMDEKVIKLASRAFPANKDALKAVKVADDSVELVKTLKENPSSLASSLGLERLVSVFSGGGKASVSALRMVKPNAGSWSDITADDLSRAFTGKQGTALRTNLIKVADEEARHATEVVEGHRAKGQAALKGLSKHAPEAVDNYLTGIFGAKREPMAPAGPVLRPDQITRLRAVPTTDPQYAKAQQLLRGL